MRRILTGLVTAAILAVVPTLTLAGNTEVAEQIAQRLRSSGQMSDYKVGIRYQEGTVWLRGRVTSEQQMNAAIRLVFQTPGVSRVVNQLSVDPSENAQPVAAAPEPMQAASQPKSEQVASNNPLRVQEAAPAPEEQPQKIGLAKRLESVISSVTRQEAPVDPVANGYHASAVQPVSAVETTEPAPQPMVVPQRVQPMPRNYVAMQQPAGVRGPMAPNGAPLPMYRSAAATNVAPARYDQPCMPNYAWPSYAAYPNYASVTYPKQYSATAWPYIGPFYPYPQVPMGWRKVTLEWDDGWWFLDFKDQPASCWHR